MNYLVGFDVGITSTRCIIIDKSGKLIASATKEYPLETPKPGWPSRIRIIGGTHQSIPLKKFWLNPE